MSKVAIVTGADRTIPDRPGSSSHRCRCCRPCPPVRGCAAKWVLPAPLTGSGRHHNWVEAGVSTSLLAHLALDPGQHRGHAA
jgi:hypothetical protein